VFGAASLILGLLTAAGALRSWTRWPTRFPFGWHITVCTPAGAGFVLLALYGATTVAVVGWTGLALLAVAIAAVFLTPRPFDESWARGLMRRH
jgi:hypothetical protein